MKQKRLTEKQLRKYIRQQIKENLAKKINEVTFQKGQKVITPRGSGTVAYQRMGGPNFSDAVAVSVVLDDKRYKPGYSGTMFNATDVQPAELEENLANFGDKKAAPFGKEDEPKEDKEETKKECTGECTGDRKLGVPSKTMESCGRPHKECACDECAMKLKKESEVHRGGKIRKVKNLGWLLKNWQEVDHFDVEEGKGFPVSDAIMTAHLRDGGKYITDWASREVMANWLNRPVFRGLTVNWFGEPLTIDKEFARAKSQVGKWGNTSDEVKESCGKPHKESALNEGVDDRFDLLENFREATGMSDYDILDAIVHQMDNDEARQAFEYINRMHELSSTLRTDLETIDRFEIFERTLEEMGEDASELLDELVRQMSDQDAREAFNFLNRMHEVPVEEAYEDKPIGKRLQAMPNPLAVTTKPPGKQFQAMPAVSPKAPPKNPAGSKFQTNIPKPRIFGKQTMKIGEAKKPKNFQIGDIVRYTGDFLRNTGQYTGTPKNGKVVDLVKMGSRMFPRVEWSDPDWGITTVAPMNLEYDPRFRSNRKGFEEAGNAKETEHSGAKKGNGAYWGRKKDAKRESNKVRRQKDKKECEKLGEGKKNFAAAKNDILSKLSENGWTLSPLNLKIVYATSPDGTLRLWFKTQAVYFTKLGLDNKSHKFKDGRTISYELDIRKVDPDKFVKWIQDLDEKGKFEPLY